MPSSGKRYANQVIIAEASQRGKQSIGNYISITRQITDYSLPVS